VIDPPFGFHWGDSMAHVEASLGYSSAEIVLRTATGQGETWVVEGLIQPGLKHTIFRFEKNALTGVELRHQYEAWPVDRYRTHLENVRVSFERRYGRKQHGRPISYRENNNQSGYFWQLGNSRVAASCQLESAPTGRDLSVNTLIITYEGSVDGRDIGSITAGDRWSDSVIFPIVARKLQPGGDHPPNGSDFALTDARLLNTSDNNQTALMLQLAVKVETQALPDPIKAVVEVNFYDTIADSQIVLTDAQVNYDWRSRRDWKQANPETLSVSYVRKDAAAGPGVSNRRFFGYLTTVYYDGRLEVLRAEPLLLLNLFPVRTFISPFESAHTAAGRKDFATAARLYRTAADRGNLFALENLAWFYARGQGVDKDLRQAAMFYERAALQNTPRSLNALAWFLATCEDGTIRNASESIRHATRACELTYWQEWKYIDTLAAGWAEAGDFKRAIEYGQQALQLSDVDDAARKKIEDRLALYRKRQPVRE